MELTWEDPSDEEAGFELQLSNDGTTGWSTISTAVPDQTRLTLTGGAAGSTFFFRLRTLGDDDNDSPFTPPISVTLPTTVAISAGIFDGGQVGEEIVTPAPVVFRAPGETGAFTFSALDLPAGLSVDEETGVLSGTPTTPGIFRPRLVVNDGTSEASTFVTLRIVSADTTPELQDGLLLLPFSNNEVSLRAEELFRDRDTQEAVRIATNVGTIDVILYPDATPITVRNFLRYVDDEAYTDVIFHRATTAGLSIIQAGFLKPDPAGEDDAYLSVPTFQPILNEPGIPNRAGTMAPAKTSNPNSATSQWFFNTIDNSGALDSPSNSGGFSVFGRASLPSLGVLNDIQSRPTGTYPLSLNGGSSSLNDWPTLTVPAGAFPDPESELLTIQSVSRIPNLIANVASNSDSSIIAASVMDDEIVFQPEANGRATVLYEVTDLDGNMETLAVEVVVVDFQVACEVGDDGQAAVSFDHLKDTSGFRYRIESSRDLEAWTDFWVTEDGFAVSELSNQEDGGDFWRLTFSVPVPSSGEQPLFFRVLAEEVID